MAEKTVKMIFIWGWPRQRLVDWLDCPHRHWRYWLERWNDFALLKTFDWWNGIVTSSHVTFDNVWQLPEATAREGATLGNLNLLKFRFVYAYTLWKNKKIAFKYIIFCLLQKNVYTRQVIAHLPWARACCIVALPEEWGEEKPQKPV